MHGDSPSQRMISSLSGLWFGQIIRAKRHLSHSRESMAIASVCASAESSADSGESFGCPVDDRQREGLATVELSDLATKISHPPCEDPSGRDAQLVSQYIPNRMSCIQRSMCTDHQVDVCSFFCKPQEFVHLQHVTDIGRCSRRLRQ